MALRRMLWNLFVLLKNGGVCFESPKSDDKKTSDDNGRLYKRRWIMLLIFSLNSTTNAYLFITLSAITNIVSQYYGVQPFVIDWLSNIFLLVYFVFGLPAALLANIYGLRPNLLLGSFLHAVAGLLRYFGAPRHRFGLVMAGQILASLACCTILQIPARLSYVWFGEKERAVATSIGAFMNIFGIAIGFCWSSQMIRDPKNMDRISHDISTLFLIQMVLCFALLLATIFFFQERPPTPPVPVAMADSKSRQNCRDFFLSIKQLLKNRNFHIVAQTYSIYFGLFNTFSILLNTIIVSKYPHGYEAQVGWMGFACLVVSIPSTLVLGILLDRHQSYRCQAVFLNGLSCLLLLIFMIILTQVRSFPGLFVIYVLYGLVGVPYYCTGLSHTAFITTPIPENTSSSLVLTLANLYGFTMVLVLGKLANDGYVIAVGYAMVALYAVALVLSAFAKGKASTKVNAEGCDNPASYITF